MNCMYCGNETFFDIGFVTDGKVSVCNNCATKHTLFEFATDLENMKIESSVKRMFSESLTFEWSDQSDLTEQWEEMENKNALKIEYDDTAQCERDAAFEITDDVKGRVEGLFDVCRIVWESTHDRKQVHEKYDNLVKNLSKQYGVSIRALGLIEPAYVYSDGTIREIPDSLLMGGGTLTDDECEMEDDIENMSEEDFLSKYVDNQEALMAWQDYHSQVES